MVNVHENTAYQRGDVYYIDLNPTKGAEINKRRPCVIIGANPINRARNTIVVVPLSSSPTPRPPIVISLPSLGEHSVAVCDQIRAVDKSRFCEKIGALNEDEMDQLDNGLRQILVL
jgi:mRNA interferase MazF